jgi:hypothetical protein
MCRGELVEPDAPDNRFDVPLCKAFVQGQRPRARAVETLNLRKPHIEPLPNRQRWGQKIYPAVARCPERAELPKHLTLTFAIHRLTATTTVHNAQVKHADPEPVTRALEDSTLTARAPTPWSH